MRAGAFSHCTFYRGSDLTFHVPAFQGNHIEWLAPFSLERSRAQLRCPRLPPAVLVTPLRCVPQRGPRCSRNDSNSTHGMDLPIEWAIPTPTVHCSSIELLRCVGFKSYCPSSG